MNRHLGNRISQSERVIPCHTSKVEFSLTPAEAVFCFLWEESDDIASVKVSTILTAGKLQQLHKTALCKIGQDAMLNQKPHLELETSSVNEFVIRVFFG